MSMSIGTTPVEKVMSSTVFTVKPKDKLSDVAKLFDQHDVNAAPVVDDANVCIGIITSHDIVEFESSRIEMQNHLERGLGFDLAHYGEGKPSPGLRIPIDEAGLHMTSKVETADRSTPLSRAAKTMCQQHIHHLVILDEEKHPVGILSSLDILGEILGEPVARGNRQ